MSKQLSFAFVACVAMLMTIGCSSYEHIHGPGGHAHDESGAEIEWTEDDTEQPTEETAGTEDETVEDSNDKDNEPAGVVNEEGEFCLLPPKARPDDLAGELEVGQEAPNWTLTDSQTGETVDITDYRGKTVMLFFWASWCPTCKMACRKNGSLNKLMTMIDNQEDANVVILGVGTATDDDANTQNAFLKTNKCTWVSTHDGDNEVESEYGVLGVPTAVIVGSNGKVLTFGRYEREWRDQVLEYLKQECVQKPEGK